MDRKIFETCLKLKDAGLIQHRRSHDFYFVTPDSVMQFQDVTALRNPIDKFSDFRMSNLVFYPTLEDLLEQITVTQLLKTVDSGIMAYQDNTEGMSYRCAGDDWWSAVANLFLLKKEEDKKAIPDVDVSTLDESNSIKL